MWYIIIVSVKSIYVETDIICAISVFQYDYMNIFQYLQVFNSMVEILWIFSSKIRHFQVPISVEIRNFFHLLNFINLLIFFHFSWFQHTWCKSYWCWRQRILWKRCSGYVELEYRLKFLRINGRRWRASQISANQSYHHASSKQKCTHYRQILRYVRSSLSVIFSQFFDSREWHFAYVKEMQA